MCNLVTLKASVDEVASAFGARRPLTDAQPGEVYPGEQGFVCARMRACACSNR